MKIRICYAKLWNTNLMKKLVEALMLALDICVYCLSSSIIFSESIRMPFFQVIIPVDLITSHYQPLLRVNTCVFVHLILLNGYIPLFVIGS
ncbi:unnamed protein product [Anisakis simplex]|uniref:Ovule protein n=1 Tax=Anisakis simplex TaxID=6269 RepID=A0A0M3JMB9_ANISI|nr:unnamed protein product [Anisakis simplex]